MTIKVRAIVLGSPQPGTIDIQVRMTMAWQMEDFCTGLTATSFRQIPGYRIPV